MTKPRPFSRVFADGGSPGDTERAERELDRLIEEEGPFVVVFEDESNDRPRGGEQWSSTS